MRKENFVDEVPFLSAALLPATMGSSSASAESIEMGLETVLRKTKGDTAAHSRSFTFVEGAFLLLGDEIADALPELRSAFGTPVACVAFNLRKKHT